MVHVCVVSVEQVGEQNRLVAAWARPARAKGPAEAIAVRAALLAEESHAAG